MRLGVVTLLCFVVFSQQTSAFCCVRPFPALATNINCITPWGLRCHETVPVQKSGLRFFFGPESRKKSTQKTPKWKSRLRFVNVLFWLVLLSFNWKEEVALISCYVTLSITCDISTLDAPKYQKTWICKLHHWKIATLKPPPLNIILIRIPGE